MGLSRYWSELLAQRRSETPPAWVNRAKGLSTPMLLIAAAESMPMLRKLCEEQFPEPLKRRGFLAPLDFLTSL